MFFRTFAAMKTVRISDQRLQVAAQQGMDEFLNVFVEATLDAIGGSITAENLPELSSDQVTLLAYHMLREEVMDGGFVQLIHNGYGSFFFRNPFARAIREWGLPELAALMNRVRKQYAACHEEIERDCTDEEFMALFERYPRFDDFDDEFVEKEEEWTAAVAHYVDDHIDHFAEVISEE